ncbi:MAG: hypothetical protein JXB39_10495 [Deltaproteobacteria bacterium]|nr:hypothetical protein [Deltaproteobacteria bacterium]
MERSHLAVFLVWLPACGTPSSDTGPGGDADADADTDPESCCVHSGLRNVGGTWRWAFTEDHEQATGESGSWTRTLERDGERRQVTEKGVTYDHRTGMEVCWTAVFTYVCDGGGVWIVHSETEYTYESGTVAGDGWSDTTYTDPGRVMPRWIEMGSTWTQRAGGTIRSEASIVDFSYTTEYAVTDTGPITVPAGTFDTLEVEWTGSAEMGTFRAAPGVGTVWTTEEVLLEWSTGR